MKPTKQNCILLLMLLSFFSQAQKQNNIWYIGDYAGIDFNSGTAVALNNSVMLASESSASICDANGNLLFYTNGKTIWDNTHTAMPNGTGLLGGSSTQSALIIPKPLSCGSYYIFHVGDNFSQGDFRYTQVDMCLNGGKGDVVTTAKNILLFPTGEEKMAAIPHSNGKDIWVITHEMGNNKYQAYLVTAAGINPIPVISAIGAIHTTDHIGPIKASHDGKKIVASCTFDNVLDLFDFNAATGTLTNYVDLFSKMGTSFAAFYGLEFSPNNTIIYGTTTWLENYIYQIDLSSYTFLKIDSLDVGNYQFGGLQLAPDGKIYMARNYQNFISAVNNPDVLGMGCNFTTNAFTFTIGTSALGLITLMPVDFINAYQNNYSIDLGKDTAICNGTPITLTIPNTCNTTFLWSTAETSNSITINTSGEIWVIATNACGSDQDSIQINIGSTPATPTITASPNDSICTGSSVTLTASGGSSYQWGGGSTAITNPIIDSPTSNSTYSVVAISNGCKSIPAIINIALLNPPTVMVTGIISICEGQSTILTASGANSYQWSGGSSSTSNSITINPSITTTYSIIGTSNGCTSAPTNITVTVNALPAVNVTGDTTLCTGETTTLTLNGGTSYQWSGSSMSTSPSITITPTSNQTYTVTTTASNSCTSNPKVINVTVSALPTIVISGNDSICAGSSSSLTATGANTYSWSPSSSLNTATGNTVAASPGTTTTYTITGDQNGCSNTGNFTLTTTTINTTISNSQTINLGSSITLNATGGTTYNWQPSASGGLSCTSCNNPVSTPGSTITYTVIITDANGCSDTKTVTITVDLNCKEVFFPTAFSPNEDGMNDLLIVRSNCLLTNYSLKIYNRWGEKIFESNDPLQGWDGKFNGQVLNTGIFSYIFSATVLDGTEVSKKGTVSLVR